MKSQAVGIGIAAWFAYGIVLALVDIFVGLPGRVTTVMATVIVVAAVATAVMWYRRQQAKWPEETELPPPGWHVDPEDPEQQRFWDGRRWTDQRAPRTSN